MPSAQGISAGILRSWQRTLHAAPLSAWKSATLLLSVCGASLCLLT